MHFKKTFPQGNNIFLGNEWKADSNLFNLGSLKLDAVNRHMMNELLRMNLDDATLKVNFKHIRGYLNLDNF